jgi:hypothetical protein
LPWVTDFSEHKSDECRSASLTPIYPPSAPKLPLKRAHYTAHYRRVGKFCQIDRWMGKGSEWTRYMSSFLSFLVFLPRLPFLLTTPFAPPAATGSHRQLVADDGRLAPFSHARADQLCLTAVRKCSCDIGCPRTRVRRRRVRAAEPAAGLSTGASRRSPMRERTSFA